MNHPALQLNETARFLEPGSATARLHAQASQLIPGATSRLHYHFKPYPIYARSGRGCRLTDIDGDQRIDCLNNMTALIHGHADADVSAAIVEQVQRGVSFSEPAEPEVALARLMCERVPSVQKVHFRSSGTEAVMMAVKLARAFTGRHRIAKFEGAYHGYYDYVQVSFSSTPANWGSAQAPQSVPSSGGLSPTVGDDVLVLPFNDRAGVERLLAQHGKDMAALLFEPLSNRAGMVLPQPGFLNFLHQITRQYGIVLIFDEVIAFRLGQAGAQGRYGGKPDLTAFGKIIGAARPGLCGAAGDLGRHLQRQSAVGRGWSGDAEQAHPGNARAARRDGPAHARRPEPDLSRRGAEGAGVGRWLAVPDRAERPTAEQLPRCAAARRSVRLARPAAPRAAVQRGDHLAPRAQLRVVADG